MVRKPSYDCNGMKKGAWSEDEDNKLRAYIMRYGHWNWRLLPKYAGLARCGKSCRLRWENYLKPGIKRGNFSKHEQDLVVELHNKLGNKWSAIAAKLPGRSDNEIKNFWHSRIEKRRNKAINPTKEAHNAQLLDQEKPSQFTFCNTTQDESISFDCLIEFEDSKLSFDTAKSSETVEKTLVDFNNYDYIWRDIFLENDTAFYSQITCLPPLQEDDFKNYEYKELSSSESSYQSAMDWNLDDEHSIITSNNVAHESVHGDFWSESFELYNSNSTSQCENSYVSEDIEGFYDPCLEYFDYGMDLFS